MARRLVLRRAAERDLAEQVEYIAREQPAAARRYLLAVERAFERLLDMPELGERWRFKNPALQEIRMWPVPGFKKFLIFYRATVRGIEVVRVLHAAQDIGRTLGERRRDR